MKKLLISGMLLLIGALLPVAALISHDYFQSWEHPLNYDMLFFAGEFAVTSLVPAAILALIYNLDNYEGISWAFYTSIVAHYILTLVIYSEGSGNEPMGFIFIPIMFVAPFSLIGGFLGFIAFTIRKRIGEARMK